jgi:cobalt/nickel transport system permease protein
MIDSGPVLLGGAVAAGIGVAIGLWRTDEEKIPQTGVMAAAFFVVSSIHVPVGMFTVHLTLAGLAGVVLGWAVFPAILVGLLLQVLLFGVVGGWTTLGLNTLTFAIPAILCYYLYRRPLARCRRGGPAVFALGFAVGATGMLGSCLVLSGILLLAGREYGPTVYFIQSVHVPLLIVEGIVTGTICVSLKRLRPDVLDSARLCRVRGPA